MSNCDFITIKDIRLGLKNINVTFIVLEIGPVTVTRENREVRNFKVGDPTACINASIWDEPGRLIVPGDIIRLTKGYASIWRDSLTLYSGKYGKVCKVGEFCMTFNEAVNMSEPRPQQQQIGAISGPMAQAGLFMTRTQMPPGVGVGSVAANIAGQTQPMAAGVCENGYTAPRILRPGQPIGVAGVAPAGGQFTRRNYWQRDCPNNESHRSNRAVLESSPYPTQSYKSWRMGPRDKN